MRRKTEARYKIGKAHETLIPDIQNAINKNLGVYDETAVVRLALEELWKRATKKKTLPSIVMKFHKVYNSDDGLD